MKLSLILITWFIISIPAGILLGRLCAAGNGFLPDSAPSQETKSETLVDLQTLEEHPAKKAAQPSPWLPSAMGRLAHCCVQLCHSVHFSLKPHPSYEHSMRVYFYGTNAFNLLNFAWAGDLVMKSKIRNFLIEIIVILGLVLAAIVIATERLSFEIPSMFQLHPKSKAQGPRHRAQGLSQVTADS